MGRATIGIILACVLLVAGGVMVKVRLGAVQPEALRTEARPTVSVSRAKVGEIHDDVTFAGELRPYQQIDLYATVPGFVREINVDIGDQVRAGDLLATLEIPNLEQDIAKAKAACQITDGRIDRLAAEYADAHSQFLRISQAAHDSPTLLAQQDIDDSSAKDQAAYAALAEGRSDKVAAMADLDRLLNTKALCRITAPFDGTVTKRYSDAGSFVRGGDAPSAPASPLIRLSQITTIRLVFSRPGMHVLGHQGR